MIDFMTERQQVLLQFGSRRRLVDYIERVPGIHMRQLQKDLGLPLSTLEYHLHQLERAEVLTTVSHRRYKAYFLRNRFDADDRWYLYHLRQEMPRRIIRLLLEDPQLSHGKLSELLPIRPSTLSHHLHRLTEVHIVQPMWVNGRKFYRIEDRERTRRLLDAYSGTFWRRFPRTTADGPAPPHFPLASNTVITAPDGNPQR